MQNFIYKHRRGTTAALENYNGVIHDGEIVVEEMPNIDPTQPSYFKLKIGDGIHAFSELPYAHADPNDHNHDGRYYTEAEINDLIIAHTSDVNNPHEVTASQVGLGNVNNTADINKPISVAQQAALDTKLGLHATADKAAADASGNTITTTYTTKNELTTHNTAVDAHNDIRVLVAELTSHLNALADSDDTTLDQLSEIVAYIQANRSLIEGVTTNKINVTDIINNLTTNAFDKPLSAAQGVVLKALIDAIEIPTNISAFINDSGYLTAHQDISGKVNITDLATVATSGSYNDLEDKPNIAGAYTLPTASSDTLGGVKVGAGLSIMDGTLSATGGGVADSVEWNNIVNKPTIPNKTSDLTNDSGYLTAHQDVSGKANTADLATVATSGDYNDLSNKPDIAGAYTLPTASADTLGGVKVGAGLSVTNGVLSATGGGVADAVDWSNIQNKPMIPSSAADIGADASGTAASAVSSHNTATDSHGDIRALITGLTTRFNALADSDDTTLDQLSEIVTYIQSNRGLIDSVTTSKVNVTDIVNNLTTNVVGKPLSAAQGVALKSLIDAIEMPTNVSELVNDAGYLTAHQDIGGKANVADLATVATSGSYTDLSNKPSIPTTLKNPTALTAGGKSYDGSVAVTITASDVGAAATSHTHVIANVDGLQTALDGKLSASGNAATATKATQDANGNVITTTYATKAEIPTSLPANGGTAASVPWSGVTDKPLTYAPAAHNHIISNVDGLQEALDEKLSTTGNAATATKATKDSADQQINTTYIKGLSVDGKVITYTKGDDTTGTITTQDTNTTYSEATTSTAGLMSATDKTKLDGLTSASSSTVDYTATIGVTWAGTAAPYTQDITITGILATDNPIVDIVPSDVYETAIGQLEAWGKIYRIVASGNKITVYSSEANTVEIPIQLKVVRQ